MEEFRKTLQRRQTYLSLGLLFAAVVILLGRGLARIQSNSVFAPEIVSGFHTGLATAFTAVLLFRTVRIRMMSKNPEQMKKLYIAETDERTLLIKQKSGSVGMNFVLYGLLVGACVAGYFEIIAFFTLLCATVFVALVRLSLKLYYRRKY